MAVRQFICILLAISVIDNPFSFHTVLIQLTPDIVSILFLPPLFGFVTYTVEGLGVAGESFFMHKKSAAAGLSINSFISLQFLQ
ncbi:hypothetical protein AB1K09_05360 [Solibacillus silvestris]